MVGAPPKELESVNELIKFDHVYFKSEPATSNAMTQMPIAMETQSVDEAVPVVPNSGNSQEYNIDSHTPENVISIKDFESLESLLSEDWISMVTDNCDTISKDKLSGAGAALHQPLDCAKLQSQGRCGPHVSNVHQDTTKLAPVGTMDTMCAGSLSDSGLSDYSYSDAGSPNSVGSSMLSDDVWEESFGELFPCLL